MFGLLETAAFWAIKSDIVPYLTFRVALLGEHVILPTRRSVIFHESPSWEKVYESFAIAAILPSDDFDRSMMVYVSLAPSCGNDMSEET